MFNRRDSILCPAGRIETALEVTGSSASDQELARLFELWQENLSDFTIPALIDLSGPEPTEPIGCKGSAVLVTTGIRIRIHVTLVHVRGAEDVDLSALLGYVLAGLSGIVEGVKRLERDEDLTGIFYALEDEDPMPRRTPLTSLSNLAYFTASDIYSVN